MKRYYVESVRNWHTFVLGRAPTSELFKISSHSFAFPINSARPLEEIIDHDIDPLCAITLLYRIKKGVINSNFLFLPFQPDVPNLRVVVHFFSCATNFKHKKIDLEQPTI